MELFHALRSLPVTDAVKRSDMGSFRTTVASKNPVTGEVEVDEISLPGITAELAKRFYPNYDARKVSANTTKYASKLVTSKYNNTSSGSRGRRRSKRNFHTAQMTGLALGSRVHSEMHKYIRTMNFASESHLMDNSARQRLRIFENLVNTRNGADSSGVHPCTRAIIKFVFETCRWIPVAAEWVIGDLIHHRHATQIDLIAVSQKLGGRDANSNGASQKLILCELKTGYNKGRFHICTGMMSHFSKNADPIITDAPVFQAKLQLVMGALMFCNTYNIPLTALDLYVIHCPSSSDNPQVSAYRVTDSECAQMVDALYATGTL